MKDLDLRNPRHRNLARLILARRDIRAAQMAAQYIIDNVKAVNDRMFQPLTCTAVISYARPFVHSRGYAPLPKPYETFQSEGMRVLHSTIMNYRNGYVAHSDADLNKVMLIPKGSEVSWSKGKGTVISHGDLDPHP